MNMQSGALGPHGRGRDGTPRARLTARRRGGRENTEGEYSGLEHEVVEDVIESIKARSPHALCVTAGGRGFTLRPDIG